MNSLSKIIYLVLRGKNNFCSLCLKIDQNSILHNELNILIDGNEQNIPLSDVLERLFGKEIHEYWSAFNNICQDCIYSLTRAYTFINSCKNKAMSLMQALDGIETGLDIPKNINKHSKSLFVALNLQDHTSKHIYDEHKLHSTSAALKRYQYLNWLMVNDSIHALKKEKRIDMPYIKTTEMVLDKNEEMPRCKQCLKRYPSLCNLRAHYKRVHAPRNYKCPICSKRFSSPGLVSYHVSIDHCEYVCSACGKEFRNIANLKRHELTHNFKLVCPDCGRSYKNSATYKTHLDLNVCKQDVRASPEDAQYTCDHCGKKYTQKMSLRVHIQYVHGGYKAHECKWCSKKFWAQSRLKAHIVKHTKEKNFTCSVCQGKFVTKESLLYHSRLHTGEKPYKCLQCDCTFISSSRRAYHMKSYHLHAMVECDGCHGKFTSRAYLDKHKRGCQKSKSSAAQMNTNKSVTTNLQEDKPQSQIINSNLPTIVKPTASWPHFFKSTKKEEKNQQKQEGQIELCVYIENDFP